MNSTEIALVLNEARKRELSIGELIELFSIELHTRNMGFDQKQFILECFKTTH